MCSRVVAKRAYNLYNMKASLLALCVLLLMSCGGRELQSSEMSANAAGGNLRDSTEYIVDAKAPDWVNNLIADYIEHGNNELVRTAKTDTSIHLSWIFDRTEKADTATYLIYRLGHSFEQRYVTEAWLYIDSNKRMLYEYDIANDKLLSVGGIRW